jgi:hypothetical protein
MDHKKKRTPVSEGAVRLVSTAAVLKTNPSPQTSRQAKGGGEVKQGSHARRPWRLSREDRGKAEKQRQTKWVLREGCPLAGCVARLVPV